MRQILLLLSVLSRVNAVSVYSEDGDQRITHGVNAPEGLLPFMASILQKEDHACGGSIISNHLILTAAHCCFDLSKDERYEPEDLSVAIGSVLWRQGTKHKVKEAIVHEEFSLGLVGYDVAVLLLEKPMRYTRNVQPVALNPTNININTSLTCITAGWGYRMFNGKVDKTTEHPLQYVVVKTISLADCQKRIEDRFEVNPTYICVFTGRGKGTCNADSGAPLIHKNRQIGILSLGLDCKNELPEFYTRISDHYQWIKNVMDKR